MKTIEEVKNHIVSVGYNDEAKGRICGFLVAKELKGVKDKLRFKLGDRNFEDFLDWFDDEEESYGINEICFGDCIHVQDGLNVVALGCVYGDTFVATDGAAICPCKVTKQTRPCNEKEADLLQKQMDEENIAFDYDMMCLAPLNNINDCKGEIFENLMGYFMDDESCDN